uniref:Alpha-type protein kinase domain-containing protein n=1 Tax=Arion vulgaris TaxID=1028688 RepID=A0A0B7B1W5_9EUPU
MPKLAHSTLQSSMDANGDCHKLYIDPFSPKDGKYYRTYSAKKFGFNRFAYMSNDGICVAKFPASCPGTREWALQEIKNSREVREPAKRFLKTLNENGLQLTFSLPQYVSLDGVATFSKKRKIEEYTVFEDTLSNFTHFVDTSGKVVSPEPKRSKKWPFLLKCQSSRRQCSNNTADSSDTQNSYRNVSIEAKTSTHNVMDKLTPTCPPWEEDSPPTYEEIFGISSQQNYLPQFQDSDCTNNNMLQSYVAPTVRNANLFNSTPCFHTDYCQDVRNNEDRHSHSETPNFDVEDQEDNDPYPLLRALIHHNYCENSGQRIISNLKGTKKHGEKYTLTTPTIHSLTRSYGERDMGEKGIMKVIQNHKCSKWCRHLPSMREIFQEAQINAISNMNRP